jgi:hypothetical protein
LPATRPSQKTGKEELSNGNNLLANWAFPRASITIHLQVGLEIETLNVLALVAAGR